MRPTWEARFSELARQAAKHQIALESLMRTMTRSYMSKHNVDKWYADKVVRRAVRNEFCCALDGEP